MSRAASSSVSRSRPHRAAWLLAFTATLGCDAAWRLEPVAPSGATPTNASASAVPASSGQDASSATPALSATLASSGQVASSGVVPSRVRRRPVGVDAPPRVALGTVGAVASQEAHATDVGLAILQAGGNAVDAAVAVGFALAVTHPVAGNVGGGGFMVIRTPDGASFALDFREVAPLAATRDMYLDAQGEPTKASLEGPLAAGIPGSVAGLGAAHARFGRLPWRSLVEPAIRLARDGFAIDTHLATELDRATKRMAELGFASTVQLFRKSDGTPLAAGEMLRQPELAQTLEAIAKDGSRAFYEGPLADRMATEVARAGGIWTARDLREYEAKWRTPLVFGYRGHEVATMPPPSAGGVGLRQLLAASETLRLEQKPWRSADEIHLFAEAMRRSFADRNALLGDPDFVNVPLAELLDPAYVARRVADVDPNKTTPSAMVKPGIEPRHGSTHTTHYSVATADGAAVSTTTTLNMNFGAKFAVPGTGVLLNDEMDDFASKPGSANGFGLVQGEANKIEPKKRMLSSMTPTILSKGGDVRAVLGSPGGPTITTTVAQLVRAVVDYGQPLDVAVPALRAHHQWLPDELTTEEAIAPELRAALEAKGHKIVTRPRIGHANCIEVDPATGGFRAVADTTRSSGKAAAY